jgi:hypothetical protein
MVSMAAEYELEKALSKLRHPALRQAKPEERWHTTQWYGVSNSVMRTLLLLGDVEHKTTEPSGKDLWREKR